jgi:hypothetical protein
MMSEMNYFSITDFNFDDRHLKALITAQSDQDKQLFNLDITNIRWDKYFLNSIYGIKKYILKDSEDATVGQKRYQK